MSADADHQRRIVEGIILTSYASRKDIYALPGLAGDVDDHGCNRISQKMQSVYKELAKAHGIDLKVVDQLKKGVTTMQGTNAEGTAGGGSAKGMKRKAMGDLPEMGAKAGGNRTKRKGEAESGQSRAKECVIAVKREMGVAVGGTESANDEDMQGTVKAERLG